MNPYAELVRHIGDVAVRRVAAPDWLDKGHILADGSLKADRFAVPFPKGTYYWLYPLSLPDPMTVTTGTVVGDHGTHTHDVVRPTELQPPIAGMSYEVLIAWISDGADPVILGILQRVP
jgi:hypothetical protein